MNVILTRYNKVTNQAFNKFAAKCPGVNITWVDLESFGPKIDILNYTEIEQFLDGYRSYDAILVGDVFWPTGQNICRWADAHSVICYFLQHGQWIYMANKRSPPFVPTGTFVYGDNLVKECSSWPYAAASKMVATGNPRYDDIEFSSPGEYVYFSPPVIFELSPSAFPKQSKLATKTIMDLRGIDKNCELMIHPHYREASVEALRQWFPKAKIQDPKDDPFPLIAGSKKVLTHRNSTVVLDAIAHGKETVLVNFIRNSSHYQRGYFGKFARESDSPSQCIKLLSDESSEPVLDEEYVNKAKEYIHLGSASERILSIITHGSSINSDL